MNEELIRRVNATAMIVYLRLVKGEHNWSDADRMVWEQAVTDLDIQT